MAEKDRAAVALGRKRWKNKSVAAKTAHSQMMNAERWKRATPEEKRAAASAAAKARWAEKRAAKTPAKK